VLVDEWVETLWTVLQVRPKTVHDYKRLYRRHLKDLIGSYSFEEVPIPELQIKLILLPPQTTRHCLMLAKTIWRIRSLGFPAGVTFWQILFNKRSLRVNL